jgi:2-polyprenyl-6-methoxyphenol hydroxylase-like FAD-dependent oxidoreductase
MIGLNGRGQAVLRNLGVMDRIDTASSLVLGRLDWQPNSAPDSPKPTYYTTRTYKTRCIQRDRLASCLLQELREKHGAAVSVMFGARCVQAEWRQGSAGGQEVRQLKLRWWILRFSLCSNNEGKELMGGRGFIWRVLYCPRGCAYVCAVAAMMQ